jgi:hypothetical protein
MTHMNLTCKACSEEVDGHASYCRCGGQYHEECRERHEDWCPRSTGDRWLGAVER